MNHKVALVTGSTSGIGLGIARALAGKGYRVMLNGFFPPSESLSNTQQGQLLAQSLTSEFGVDVFYTECDLSQADNVKALIDACISQLGGIDILVNNAGVQHTAPVQEFAAEQWDRIIAINLSAAFHTIHHAIPHMQQKGWGRIINIASVHGLVASVNKAAYVAAKHGIVGLTKVVALENAEQGITANAICPGWVSTDLIQQQIVDLAAREDLELAQAQHKLVTAKQPLPNMTSTTQIGEWVAFLCSDTAATTTGTTIAVDGGWTAQ